ncbi:nudC domain-containing protein 3 [Trichogramma pretiosum]|uniref:nudC domain-containing protein 3 n=1 Tax=Trichogramma pretiosum TaxID=7493 RepID=UPI0006C9AE4D|nr:nudC domain-containing protein 3 [Trichogramma pretiosum]
MEERHDEMFMEILRDEKNLSGFLDAFCGFLYRRTDFYVEATPETRVGYPPGIAEQILLTISRKWQDKKKESQNPKKATNDADQNKESKEPTKKSETGSSSSSSSTKNEPKKSKLLDKPFTNCYNGATYDNYSWSQTIGDIDCLVKVPETIKKSKQVKVDIKADSLLIKLCSDAGQWDTHFEGKFSFNIRHNDSFWCLEPGKTINLHLSKGQERWWENMLESEPKIELSKIDCSRPMDDMTEGEQMKIEELMWNQRQKELGLPTSEDAERKRKEEQLLKAWNADDSPFKGKKIDLSKMHFK